MTLTSKERSRIESNKSNNQSRQCLLWFNQSRLLPLRRDQESNPINLSLEWNGTEIGYVGNTNGEGLEIMDGIDDISWVWKATLFLEIKILGLYRLGNWKFLVQVYCSLRNPLEKIRCDKLKGLPFWSTTWKTHRNITIAECFSCSSSMS